MIEGRYKFIERIGKGAFGTVLLMEDTVVDDRLILKFLNPNVSEDEEMMKRFVHELRYSRKITHHNVIRIYDFLHIQGNYAISMEYFPSHTLGAEIVNEKPVETKRAVQFGIDMCTGMTVAHKVGIVHRDLKPANVLINDDGLLKIVDFGVAAAHREGDTQLTKTGYVIGSPKYMAPEQILGRKVDERADVYAVGVILYEMFTGVPPYSRGDHMAVMYQHVQGKARVAAGNQSEAAAGPVGPDHEGHGGRQGQALPEHGRAAGRARTLLHDVRSASMARIDAFLKLGTQQGCSDIHLAVGVPPMLRMYGDLVPIKFRDLRDTELEGYITEILTPTQADALRAAATTSISPMSRPRAGAFASTCSARTPASAPCSAPSPPRSRRSTSSACRRSSRSCATTTRA